MGVGVGVCSTSSALTTALFHEVVQKLIRFDSENGVCVFTPLDGLDAMEQLLLLVSQLCWAMPSLAGVYWTTATVDLKPLHDFIQVQVAVATVIPQSSCHFLVRPWIFFAFMCACFV